MGRLVEGEDKNRSKFNLNASDELSDIPAEFWKDVGSDWNRPAQADPYYGESEPDPYVFFIEYDPLDSDPGIFFVTEQVEASRVEALTFLRRFDAVSGPEKSISPEVKNRFTNRGGAPTKYDWVGAAAHIAAFVDEVGLPPVQRDLRREVEQFFCYQHRIPDEKDLKQFVGQYYKSAEELRLRRKKHPPRG
jgi:hypothetical protein